MINTTVKTLDSNNHAFSVSEDITVKEFKEHIAADVGITADKQRLIYCGRVLQDDKKLNEYDVNGKVIHLVQRAPPQPHQNESSGTGTARPNAAGSDGHHHHHHFHHHHVRHGPMDGSTMYLGTLSFPTDSNDPQAGSSSSQIRMNTARRMLQQTEALLEELENPRPVRQSDASADSQNSSTSGNNSTSAAATSTAQNEANTSAQSSTEPQQEHRRFPRTVVLADLLAEMTRVHQRLQPHADAVRNLMQGDPANENEENQQRHQTLFNTVSECFHYVSHAYHAISDIICNFGQAPPRDLRARPFVIQQSTYLQAGMPIQAQINIMATTSSPDGSPNPSGANASSQQQQPPPQSQTHTQSTSQPHSTMPDVQNLPQGFNIPPGNPVFVMEVGPTSITVDNVPVGSNGDNANIHSSSDQHGPHGWAPPQELIRNVIQYITGQTTTMRSSTSAPTSNPTVSGQNSQARGNTATNPTTSTQTRSTSRPHVQLPAGAVPLGIPGMGASNFDVFLPCNSHHVQGERPSRQGMQGVQMVPPTDGNALMSLVSAIFGAQPNRAQRPGGSNAAGSTPAPSQPRRPGDGAEDQPRPQAPSSDRPAHANAQPPVHPFNIMSQLLSQTQSQSSGASGASSDNMPVDQIFSQMFEGVLGQYAQILAGQNVTTTIGDIFRSMPESAMVDGESALSNVVISVANHATFQDVMRFMQGNHDALNYIRPHFLTAVRENMLGGRDINETNVREVVEQIVNSWIEQFEACAREAQVRENVDYVATLHRFATTELYNLLMALTSADEQSFGSTLQLQIRSFIARMITLSASCFTDGQRSVESVIRFLVNWMTEGANPLLQQWSVNAALNHLCGVLRASSINEEDVRQYITSPGDGARWRREIHQTEQSAPHEDIVVSMEVESTPVEAEKPVEPPMEQLFPAGASSLPDTPMETIVELESLPDVAVGSETWHAAMPPEWVPVISQDVQRQRRQLPPAPFSDAYISTMPSKRRKVINSEKPQGNSRQSLADSLRRAINTVQPQGTASTDQVVREATENRVILTAYQEEAGQIVAERLRNDRDFDPKRFPAGDTLSKK